MTRILALPHETRGHILDGVRRVELLLLLMLGALLGFYYEPWGVALALPMFATAVILVPRERAAVVATREQERVQFLDKVATEGQELRQRYVEILHQAQSDLQAHSEHQIERQIRLWIESVGLRFAGYPEFAAIFQAHEKDSGLLAELDSCLTRIGEIQRLCRLSEKLRLPI
jgi:hypothetical protein